MASEELISSVADANEKTVAEGPAQYLVLAFGNAVAHQNRLNILAEAALGNMTRRMSELDPAEAASILKTTQGDLAAQLAALAASLAGSQQGAKTAQTTPPVTG